MYAALFNYEKWEDVPEQLRDSSMELSIAHWMGLYRNGSVGTVDSLAYAVSQLLSDVRSSIAGERGAHRDAMLKVERLMKELQNEAQILDEQSREIAGDTQAVTQVS